MLERAVYFSELTIAPILALTLLITSKIRPELMFGLFLGGVVTWTLGEYAGHRFVLHDLAPTQHRIHHGDQDTYIVTIFWPIWICFAVVGLVAGGVVLAGSLSAYAWYLFVHHCAHHQAELLPNHLAKHHAGHHKFATRNFGVSTALWDHAFGTVLK